MGSLIQGQTRYYPMHKRAMHGAEQARLQGLSNAKEQIKPYQEYGAESMRRQNRLFNDPSYLQETGGYKFAMEQGLKGTTAARSNTSIFSGETLKALTEYSAGLASQEYGKEWDRLQKGIDVGANASNTMAEIEAGTGEASARKYDQKSAYLAGYENTSRAFNKSWNDSLASTYGGGKGGGG